MIAVDASALLALLFREPGAERVVEVLDACVVSTVNLAEVLGRFARDGHNPRIILDRLVTTAIEWAPFEETQAERCARLLPITQPFGLSLGDRACLALAQSRNVAALTADRVWAEIEHGVPIELIR